MQHKIRSRMTGKIALIIHQSRTIAATLQNCLVKCGFVEEDIIWVINVSAALPILDKLVFDLVLTQFATFDKTGSGYSGQFVCEKVKSQNPGTKTVVLIDGDPFSRQTAPLNQFEHADKLLQLPSTDDALIAILDEIFTM